MASGIDIYGPCDSVVRETNRELLREFGRLKLAKWDQVNVIRTVTDVYRRSRKKAKKRYMEVMYDAYLLGLTALCGVDPKKAKRMADQLDTEELVDLMLEEVNPVTRYRFNEEAERKAYRLAESMEIATNRNLEIDRALRNWSGQIGQYAILVTDAALLVAFEDAGAEEAEWVTRKDERVCHECRALDGKVFPIEKFPQKPHLGCRCGRRPVGKGFSPAKAE